MILFRRELLVCGCLVRGGFGTGCREIKREGEVGRVRENRKWTDRGREGERESERTSKRARERAGARALTEPANISVTHLPLPPQTCTGLSTP